MAVVLEGWCSLPVPDESGPIPLPYVPLLSSEVTDFSGDYVGESLRLYIYSPFTNQAYMFQDYLNSSWNAVSGVVLQDRLFPFTFKIYLVRASDFSSSSYVWGDYSNSFESLSLGKYNCEIQGYDGIPRYWTPDATPLSTPTGLYADNITSDSARVSWSAVENASGYKVEYRKQGDTTWNE